MAETITTPDGKTHVLLGSTTELSLIREYCGDELADRLREALDDWYTKLNGLAIYALDGALARSGIAEDLELIRDDIETFLK